MTNPENILARATPRGGQYESHVGGGLAQFTSAQVGQFLAGMKQGTAEHDPLADGAVRILLLRYCHGDARDVDELVEDLLTSGGKIKDWIAHGCYTAICRAVLREFLIARRCGTCEGRTTCMRGDLVELCEDCRGTGYKPHTVTSRAKLSGIPAHLFRNRAGEQYYVARLADLTGWEDAGLRRVVAKARNH